MVLPTLLEKDQRALSDVASDIGEQLCRAALIDGKTRHWPRDSPRDIQPYSHDPGDATVYAGSAGISIVLGELLRAEGSTRIEEVAVGALRHALESDSTVLPSHCGFFNGRVGSAYAAFRVGEAAGDPTFIERGRRIVDELHGHESEDYGIDVISGAAGAIPVLLRLQREFNIDVAGAVAVGLGDNLLARARREPTGWSWDFASISSVRNLSGFAHGASGIASALLDLFDTTDDTRYLYAAEQALLFERQFFNHQLCNWRDNRHSGILQLQEAHGIEGVAGFLSAGGKLKPYEPSYSCAWCHGAPGMIDVRLRIGLLLHEPTWLEEARLAETPVTASLYTTTNYSLCHGSLGNAEALYRAARVSGDVRLGQDILTWSTQIPTWHESPTLNWRPSGAAADTDKVEYSLMLGLAGVAYYCLMLANPDVPSILFPGGAAGSRSERAEKWRDGCDAAYCDHFFRESIRISSSLGNALNPTRVPGNNSSAPRELYASLLGVLTAAEGVTTALLQDASAIERTRFLLEVDSEDHLSDKLERLYSEAVGERWRNLPLRVAPGVRVVETDYDWAEWSQQSEADRPPVPRAVAQTHLLVWSHRGVAQYKIDELSAQLIAYMDRPYVLKDLLDETGVADGETDELKVRAAVSRAVEQLYAVDALIIDIPLFE